MRLIVFTRLGRQQYGSLILESNLETNLNFVLHFNVQHLQRRHYVSFPPGAVPTFSWHYTGRARDSNDLKKKDFVILLESVNHIRNA